MMERLERRWAVACESRKGYAPLPQQIDSEERSVEGGDHVDGKLAVRHTVRAHHSAGRARQLTISTEDCGKSSHDFSNCSSSREAAGTERVGRRAGERGSVIEAVGSVGEDRNDDAEPCGARQ